MLFDLILNSDCGFGKCEIFTVKNERLQVVRVNIAFAILHISASLVLHKVRQIPAFSTFST